MLLIRYLEADPVIIPVNSKEDKTMVEANDEINELDMEALEVSSSMKCADLLKSKIKRKKKKLLRKVKDRNASLSQQQSSEGEIILSPPTTPREVVTLPRPKKEEVVVRESFTVDSDNVDESFTEAIIKKKGKKR